MSEQQKRKGRKALTRRSFDTNDESVQSENSLSELFDFFMAAKGTEGLRERTLTDHKVHFAYFQKFLQNSFPNVTTGRQVTSEILRQYILYMQHTKLK